MEQNTKYIFVKYLKYKILFKVIVVEYRRTYFIGLLFPNNARRTCNFNERV